MGDFVCKIQLVRKRSGAVKVIKLCQINFKYDFFLFNLTNNLIEACVIKGYKFCTILVMTEENPKEDRRLRRFQIAIGERMAFVEIISITNNICSVEFSGQEPIFITKIRDKQNQPRWVSIPQGNSDMAAAIGNYIDEYLKHQG